MSTQKPTFRVMKNGYDRFAVDDSIDKYAAEVDELEKKIKIYEDRLTKAYSDMQVLNDKCRDLQTSMDAEKQAAENILSSSSTFSLFIIFTLRVLPYGECSVRRLP